MNDLITDYFEGALGFWERLQFRLHVMVCPNCRRHIRKTRQLIAALGRIPADEQPPEELIERLSRWKSS